MITVTGTLMKDDGLPDAGATVVFTRPVYVSHADGTVYEPYLDTTVTDATGHFSIALVPTNDPAWTPVGWAYSVSIQPGDGSARYSFSCFVPYNGGNLTFGQLIPLAAPSTGQTYALTNHTHPTYETQIAALKSSIELQRVVTAGEFVLPRGEVTTELPLATGNLYVTHFRAAITENIQTIRTGVGSGVATGAQHAWIGIMSWDGTSYTPVAASVDDPTRWASSFASYNTQVFAWNHAGEGAYQGFNKVAGTDYALWMLWIGSGNAPNLFAGGGNYQDCLEAPRTNAYIGSQTQPPAAPISGAFFGPDSRRFQALLKR
jgi:hypothetical protein